MSRSRRLPVGYQGYCKRDSPVAGNSESMDNRYDRYGMFLTRSRPEGVVVIDVMTLTIKIEGTKGVVDNH